jgi:hypothetical protein
MKPKDFINKAKYDKDGQWLWRIDKKGNLGRLVDLRGWGAIQYLFPNPDKTLNLDKAALFQDEVGQWITDAINEKIERESKL